MLATRTAGTGLGFRPRGSTAVTGQSPFGDSPSLFHSGVGLTRAQGGASLPSRAEQGRKRTNDSDHREQRPLGPLTARRLLLTALGALALLAVVAVASHGDRPTGGGAADQDAATVLVNLSLLVLAVVAAAMIVVVLFSLSPSKGPNPQPRTGPKLAGQMLAVVLLLSVVVVAYALFRRARDGDRDAEGQANTRAAVLTRTRTAAERRPPPEVDWLPVVVVFTAAIVAFTAAGIVALRRGPLPDRDVPLAERLADVFDETLEDLRAEADPRRAVIATYGRMERTLGRHGLPRRPAEAPHEYVTRVLDELTASAAAVRRLTRLYERARFSEHAVDPLMKEDAIEALEAVRDELRAREVEPLVAAPR